MRKILGKLILILIPLLAAFFMLYPTYDYYFNLKPKKQEYLERAARAETTSDSLNIMEEFNKAYGADLDEQKEEALKLGLDLLGGMYVTLEIDVVKLIEESAQREAIDETFLKVIEETREESMDSEEPALDIFLRKFNEIARPKGKSLISYFDIGDIREASEDKIIERLRNNANSAIDQAKEVLTQRIDKYGVAEPNIQKQGNRRILLELPGVEDESEMRNLIQTTARLEFKLVRNNEKIVEAFREIDKYLKQKYQREKSREKAWTESETTKETTQQLEMPQELSDTNAVSESTGTVSDTAAIAGESGTSTKPDTANPYEGMADEEVRKQYSIDHQFTRLFATYYIPGENQSPMQYDYVKPPPKGDYSFVIPGDSIARLEAYLSQPEIREKIPFNLEIAIEAKPDKRTLEEANVEQFRMYCLKRDPELTGDVITDAMANFDPTTNQPMVQMSMNSEGAEDWARITGANINKQIAIVLDERVYSAPVVRNKITGGRSVIEGVGDIEEANLMEIVLKAGALKAPVQIIQERVVGPSLGEDSIESGVRSSIIAVFLVIIFMAFYYMRGGLIADFAVLLNISIVLAVLSSFGGTLTLPGIAGLILTIGMAVDANVLIFERIREELYKGRSLRSAVDEGFSKALSAVLDSNITTFITGLILFYFGSGPIKGFATTLMIGILATLFTAILISRAIIDISIIRVATQFNFGQPKEFKES